MKSRSEYHRQWYEKNREKVLLNKRRVQKEHRARNKALVQRILANSSCKDCGNPDSRVFEFDHVRGEKIGNVSEMIKGFSKDLLLEEITKCEVVCANCHRIRTLVRREREFDSLLFDQKVNQVS